MKVRADAMSDVWNKMSVEHAIVTLGRRLLLAFREFPDQKGLQPAFKRGIMSVYTSIEVIMTSRPRRPQLSESVCQ